MSIDRQRVLDDLAIADGLLHFDNAGASLMPRVVLDAQLDHLRLEAAIGGYAAARERQARLEAVYASVGRLLNCGVDEVALVENATVGWMMAFYAIPFAPGDRVLTAEAEYASNYLAYLQLAAEKGIQVEAVPSTAAGELDVAALAGMIDERVRLISVTHVPTNGGLVNPVAEIGALARAHDILYLVDACQSAGQIPLDVEAIGCDLLSATGRKYLRGPRGVGFLYVSRRIVEELHPPMIDLYSANWVDLDCYELRKDARRFENWENNYAARLGLGAAIDYALDIGIDVIEVEVSRLADRLRQRLVDVPGLTVHDLGRRRCGIVSFSIDGVDAESLEQRLREQRVNVSRSSPTSTLIDARRRELPELLRASLHYFNSDDQIERFVSLLRGMLD